MTKVTFFIDKEKQIYSFIFEGHSDYDVRGRDIVCAALSSHAFNTVYSLIELGGYEENKDLFMELNENVDSDEIFLKVEIKKSELDTEKDFTAQILLKSLLLSVENIQKEYKDNVALIVKEVR